MAGAAFDMSGFQPEPEATPAPSTEKPFDLSGFQPESAAPPEEKPSFIKRAADAVRWTEKTLGGAENSLDKTIGDLGTVEVPSSEGATPEERARGVARVKAFDVP